MLTHFSKTTQLMKIDLVILDFLLADGCTDKHSEANTDILISSHSKHPKNNEYCGAHIFF
jgi:hypothetical protein